MESDTNQQKKCSESSIDNIYKGVPSKKFRKAWKKLLKSGRKDEIELTMLIVDNLSKSIALDLKYKDHALKGNMQEFRECHISGNFLLIYYTDEVNKELHLVDLGSHSELFGK